MTDRYKGFLITLDKDVRVDDAEYVLNAIRMIKGVHSIRPYVKGLEDDMSAHRARSNAFTEMSNFILEKTKE